MATLSPVTVSLAGDVSPAPVPVPRRATSHLLPLSGTVPLEWRPSPPPRPRDDPGGEMPPFPWETVPPTSFFFLLDPVPLD